jgi:hypothetical protein
MMAAAALAEPLQGQKLAAQRMRRLPGQEQRVR